jgi:hypothetical protein
MAKLLEQLLVLALLLREPNVPQEAKPGVL